MQKLDDIMLAIHEVETTEALWGVLSAYFRGIGVTMASYNLSSNDGKAPLIRHEGFPETWSCQYFAEDLIQIDPVPELAARSRIPLYWHDIEDLAPTTKDAQRYVELLKQADIGDGLVFYVYGPAMHNAYVALGFGQNRIDLSAEIIWTIQCVAQAGHLRYCALRVDDMTEADLSNRELEILRWLARGKSNSVIASILSVSPHTIDAYVRRIYAKLEVNDRTSAVIRGIGSGLINL